MSTHNIRFLGEISKMLLMPVFTRAVRISSHFWRTGSSLQMIGGTCEEGTFLPKLSCVCFFSNLFFLHFENSSTLEEKNCSPFNVY